jgi:hypothetical protein
MGGVINFMPAYQSPGGVNTGSSQAYIPTYLCPSDISPVSDWRGQNNYVGNQGGWLCDRGTTTGGPSDIAPNETQTGVFFFLSRIRTADVLDGMSQTAFFSEKIRGSGTPDPGSDMFVISNQSSLDDTFNVCSTLNTLTATPLTSKWGFSWVMGENCCTLYNHVATPNKTTCAGIPFPNNNMTNMAMQVPPSSRHTGGVFVPMGDGAVHFINDSLDLRVWRAMGTRFGKDIYEAPF